MIKGFSNSWFVYVWIFNFWIRPTSTTVTVTAYDGTGIVQQQPLTLGCNYTTGGSDVIFSFDWKHGSVIIVSGTVTFNQSHRFQDRTEWSTSGVFLGDYTSSLTIQLPASSVTPSAAGQYTCIVSSLSGGFQDTATAFVQYAPQIESTFPSSRSVTEFSRLQIDCSSYTTPGNPPTNSYTWTYGGSTITSGAVLDLINIDRDRRGQYTCTSINTVGSDSETVSVDVQYGPGNSVQMTPEGTTALVEGSGPFTATCTADCNPECSISWRSDTRNLNSVSISNVSRTDQGNYTCQAQNGIGGPRENTITLVVYYLERPDLIVNKTEVVENETVSLTCNVESNPTAELAIRNVDNNTVLVERDTNRLQFTIYRVQCLHNGSFLCTAHNSQIYKYSANRNVNVLCSPRQDFRHKMNNIVTKQINETAALVADVIANPVPEFRWFRQESGGLTNISRDTIHSISNSRLQSILYINISRTQDYGDYVLEMENSQGRNQLLFTLTSKVPFRLDNTSMSSNSLMEGLIASIVINVCLLTVLVLGVVFVYRRGVIKKPRCLSNREKQGPQTSNPVAEFQDYSDPTTASVSPYSDLDNINSDRQTYTALKTYQNHQAISENEESGVLNGAKSPTYENTAMKKEAMMVDCVHSTSTRVY